jgi:hypothetical protein
LSLPSVEGLLEYSDLADRIRHRQIQLRPLQYRHDLFYREPLLLHLSIPNDD